MKRVLSLFLVLILVLSFTMTAFANEVVIEVPEEYGVVIMYSPVCEHDWDTHVLNGSQERKIGFTFNMGIAAWCTERRDADRHITQCSNCGDSSSYMTYGSWSHSNPYHN